MQLFIRTAGIDEIDVCFALLRESAEWLRDKGIDYVQYYIEPSEWLNEWIHDGFAKCEVKFVCNGDGEVIATYRVVLPDCENIEYQGIDTAYLYSFAVRRDMKGMGIGYEVMRMIEENMREMNIKYMRFNCGANVPRLQKYYEDFGFTAVKPITLGNEEYIVYEKRVM